jgi:hypothetical protein
MAGTYGEPGKNTFVVPGVGGILSPVVNPDTKVTQVYRGAARGTFQSLGTYNSTTRKFTPGPNTTDTENKSLSSASGIKKITDAGTAATIKGVKEAGGSADAAQAAANNVFSPNKANNPETITPITLDLQEATKSSSKTRTSFPGGSGSNPLVYPEDIRNTKQDIIKFEMLQYEARGFSTKNALAQVGTRNPKRNSIGTVILPIPSGISDTSAVTWQQETLNPAQAAAANLALTTITKGFGEGGKLISDTVKEIQSPNSNQEIKTLVAAAFAEAATGIGQQVLTRTTGAVINPNMELLFNGPTLRPFSFNFKMSARNDREAKTIIKIIRFFQQGMAPQKSESNLFLKSPHTFRIRYLHRPKGADADHPYIGAIKECALQNFTVNYTPEGQYATFHDGVMVSYEMSMSFTELEPVYNEDYGNDSDFPGDLLFRNPSSKP